MLTELNNSYLEACKNYDDAVKKQAQMSQDLVKNLDSHTDEEIKEVKAKVDKAKNAADLAKKALDDARKASKSTNFKASNVNTGHFESEKKEDFAKSFKDMLKNPGKYTAQNMMTSDSEDEPAAGLTIPTDEQTRIHELERQKDSFRELVTVENVNTDKGSRVMEKESEILPLDRLDGEGEAPAVWQNKDIPEGDYPGVRQITYNIHDYGDVFYAPKDLINDSTANILSWLNNFIANKTRVTYNNEIAKKWDAAEKTKTITNLNDMIEMIFDLDMALTGSSELIINKSGFSKLAQVRLGDGHRALTTDPVTQKTSINLDGIGYRNVHVIEDKWMPNGGTKSKPQYPVLFGDNKQFIHMFDRQQLSIATTDTGDQAFRKNQVAIRPIIRFDTQLWDKDALVKGTFTDIADIPLITGSGASVGSGD